MDNACNKQAKTENIDFSCHVNECSGSRLGSPIAQLGFTPQVADALSCQTEDEKSIRLPMPKRRMETKRGS